MKKMAVKTKPRFPELHNFLYQLAYCFLMGGVMFLFLFQLGG